MYFILQIFLLGWSIYLQMAGVLSQFDLIVVIFLSLIVELLVSMNRKFDAAEINYEDEKEEEKE
jgi:tetrahydromethanopterin S-methyltransferase subunit E